MLKGKLIELVKPELKHMPLLSNGGTIRKIENFIEFEEKVSRIKFTGTMK